MKAVRAYKKGIKYAVRITAYLLIIALTATVLWIASKGNATQGGKQIKKINFTPTVEEEGFLSVAENDCFALFADTVNAQIMLYDKQTGNSLKSAPELSEDDNGIKNAAKLRLSSMLDIEYADRDSNLSSQNSVAGCVRKKTFSVQRIENGIRFDFYFVAEGFLIPLVISLTDYGFSALVPVEEIQEESEDVKLTAISVLPNFCAAFVLDTGYAFVPDGSGALIPFGYGTADYSERVFGKDPALAELVSSGDTAQKIHMPVFGVCAESGSFLGIIDCGAARAAVNAVVARDKNPFTAVYTKFIYREIISVNISQQTFESTQANMFEPDHCGIDRFLVQYRVSGQNDYAALANLYRDYLIAEKGLQVIDSPIAALQLKLIGGVKHSENLFGVPVNRVLPVTAYDDLPVIITELRERGVEQVSVDYLYWNKGGTDEVLSANLGGESRLGGGKKLAAAVEKAIMSGGRIYPELNLTDIRKTQNGFSVKYDSAKTVREEPLGIYRYFLSTYQRDETAVMSYLLSAHGIEKLFNRWQKQQGKSVFRSFAFSRMGSCLYSDFEKTPTDRSKMQEIFENIFRITAGQCDGLLFSTANAYAFPYAKVIQEIPVTSSDYLCEGESVPFYAIALHGLIEMSAPSLNAAESQRKMLLKSVECGIEPTFTFGWRNTDGFKKTEAERYYYIDAKNHLQEAANFYNEIGDYLKAVSNKAIVLHNQVADGVYKTVFEGGAFALVNYSGEDVTVENITVPALGYTISMSTMG